jgi:RNA polymerase sigma-70 factor (ECF subfamily)
LVECRRDFLRYFRRRLGRPEDAEDAFQDFCLKVIRAQKTPDDGDMIDAWLGRILRNTLIDHYRRCASRQRGEAAYERELHVTALGVEADQEERACPCVHDALPTLKPEYAEVLRRAFFDEEPRAQIADELGLSPNNVGVRLHRARRALKQRLEESCASCFDGGFLNCDCGSVGGTSERVATSPVGCDVAA